MRAILILLAASWYGRAQSPDPSLTFEVASVKAAGAQQSGGSVSFKKSEKGSAGPSADPIRFTRRNATLARLIVAAYGLKPQQLIGPGWLTSDRYEIEAKVPEGGTAAQQMVCCKISSPNDSN